jgi:hypothetical protein
MPGLIGVVILLVLLWAARRSRASGILNIAQQRLSGALALLVAALLVVRGNWGLGLGLGLFAMTVRRSAALAAQLTGRLF